MISHLSLRIALAVCAAASVFSAEPEPARPVGGAAGALYAEYEVRNYFAVEKRLGEIDRGDARRAFFEGQLAAAFLQHAEAEKALGRFLASPEAPPDWRKEAWMALAGSRALRGEYAASAEAFERGLAVPGAHFKRDEQRDARQSLGVMRALRATVPQRQDIASGEGRLAAYRDKVGLLNVDVGVNGQAAKAIFDTGANFSCASETFARHHGLRLLPDAVEVQAATGATVPAQVGIADLVQIGPRRFRNVVFLVFKDEAIAFPQIGYGIHAIVGLPLIVPLDRVRVDAGDAIVEVGLPPADKGKGRVVRNLAFDGLTPLVAVQFGNDTMPFKLDTGAVQTALDALFARRFPAVLAGAKTVKVRTGSAGGVVEQEVRVLPEVKLVAGGKSVTLRDMTVPVAEEESGTPGFGTVGRDFLGGSFEMDFRRMRFSLTSSGKGDAPKGK